MDDLGSQVRISLHRFGRYAAAPFGFADTA
jgi:hypothetical protein